MVHLRLRAGAPPGIEVEPLRFRVGLETRHVADRRVEPDVEKLARRFGNLEPEIGRIARDVPVGEAGLEPLVQLVADRALQPAGSGPVPQEGFEVGQLEEIVLGVPRHRAGAADRRNRVDQVRGAVGRAADLAGVAILVGGPAFGAGPLDETVRQEHPGLGVVGLLDGAHGNVPGGPQPLVDPGRAVAIFLGVGAVIMIEVHQETGEIRLVFLPHPRDQFLGLDPLGTGFQHDRCAVRVIRADVDRLVSAGALKPGPDVRLDVLDEVPQVDRAVGIGQRAGDQHPARRFGRSGSHRGWRFSLNNPAFSRL